MNLQLIEKELKQNKISCCTPEQNYFTINGEQHLNILFHKYTHADKAITILKNKGYNVITGREINPFNAYFKYFITVKQ